MKPLSPRKKPLKEGKTPLGYPFFRLWKLVLFVILVGIVSGILDWSGQFFLSSWWPLAWGLFWFVLGLTKVVSLSQKRGTGFVFFLIFAIVTLEVNDVGIFGWEKVLLFFFAGILFEGLFYLINKKSLYWAKVFATTISLLALPLIASLVLSGGIVETLSIAIIDMVFLILLITFPLSLILNLIFSLLRTNTWFLRMESWLN